MWWEGSKVIRGGLASTGDEHESLIGRYSQRVNHLISSVSSESDLLFERLNFPILVLPMWDITISMRLR